MSRIQCVCGHQTRDQEFPDPNNFVVYTEEWVLIMNNALVKMRHSDETDDQFAHSVMQLFLFKKSPSIRGLECPHCGRLLIFRDWKRQLVYLPEPIAEPDVIVGVERKTLHGIFPPVPSSENPVK